MSARCLVKLCQISFRDPRIKGWRVGVTQPANVVFAFTRAFPRANYAFNVERFGQVNSLELLLVESAFNLFATQIGYGAHDGAFGRHETCYDESINAPVWRVPALQGEASCAYLHVLPDA